MAPEKKKLLEADLAYKKALTTARGDTKSSKTNRNQDMVLRNEMLKIKSKQDKLFAENDVTSLSELKENEDAYAEYMDLENTKERYLNMRTTLADEDYTFNPSEFKGLVNGNKIVKGVSTDKDVVKKVLKEEINKFDKGFNQFTPGKLEQSYSKINKIFNAIPEEWITPEERNKLGKIKQSYDDAKFNIARKMQRKAAKKGKPIKRTGTDKSGRKVIEYSDGSIEYAE